jgi:UMF1 family MFS transporter
MTRPAWLTADVRAWALYDVASSIWIATVPTLLFAVYFRAVVAADTGRADALWGITAALSLLIAGFAAPWIGARADLAGTRLRWLAAATALCCVATAAMALVGPGQVLFGVLVFVLAQVGYTVGMSLYDAYLVRIAQPETAGRISGFGWAVGFVGGIVAVLVSMRWLDGVEVSRDPRYASAFVLVALLFGAAAVPALLGLRRLGNHAPPALPPTERPSATQRVAQSVRGWRSHGNAVRFLAALYLINDAVVTIAFFAGIYFRDQFGLGLAELLRLALLYQVLAIPGTLAFGRFADRVSLHTAIYASLAVWIVAVLLMAFGAAAWVPYAVVVLFAMVFGSTQALMRGAFAVLVPRGRDAEFFGFNALAGRLSAAAGPLLYGVVSAATGSSRAALLSVLLFLLGGALVLATVRIEEPAAERSEAAG